MHRSLQRDRRHELALFEPQNRRALAALLPDAFVRQIENLWKSDDAYLLRAGEWEIAKEAKRRGKPICPLDHRLRAQFWFEYDCVQTDMADTVPTMHMPRVIGKAIGKETFYRYITEPVKLAYLLTPPIDYLLTLEFVMNQSMLALLEILELSITFPDGSPDYVLAEKKEKLIEKIHKRWAHLKDGILLTGHRDGDRPGRNVSGAKVDEAIERNQTPEEKIAQAKAEQEMLREEKERNKRGGKE